MISGKDSVSIRREKEPSIQKGRGPVELVYLEVSETKQEAMSREAKIKHMTRKEKDMLIADPAWMDRLRELGVEWKFI